jgi:SAM-dependent methyltransferase
VSDASVRDYFDEVYPARGAGLARWFRGGERDRQAVIAPWVAKTRGSILDIGVGDGRFLASVLHARVDRLTLVDLSARALERAAGALVERARVVETREGCVRELDLEPADTVLALGVTDYIADWPSLITRLRSLARIELIVDFPRAGRLRSIARRAWLQSRGISLQTGSERTVRSALSASTIRALASTRLHWIARVSGGDAQ